MNDISPREYGQLEMQVRHLTESMLLMQADLKAMRDMMEQGKGSWRTLVYIGGAAASLGAFASWLMKYGLTIR